MRISDWSSDVCSSDLLFLARRIFGPQRAGADRLFGGDERRGEALRVRTLELVVHAEGDGDVDLELANGQWRVEQRREAGEMPFDLAVLIIGDQPREAAVEIVVELGAVTGERKAARDLIDELLAALAGQEGGEILEIDDARGDDGDRKSTRLNSSH